MPPRKRPPAIQMPLRRGLGGGGRGEALPGREGGGLSGECWVS